MKGVLFYQFICCSAIIASSLTAFHRYSDTLSFDLVFALAPMVTELFSIYIYCSYTDELTTDVRKIGYIFYDSLWYEMNVREQKCVTLIIQRAQKPFQWNGYGNCSCSHRKLLKVRKRRFFFHHLLLISTPPNKFSHNPLHWHILLSIISTLNSFSLTLCSFLGCISSGCLVLRYPA